MLAYRKVHGMAKSTRATSGIFKTLAALAVLAALPGATIVEAKGADVQRKEIVDADVLRRPVHFDGRARSRLGGAGGALAHERVTARKTAEREELPVEQAGLQVAVREDILI